MLTEQEQFWAGDFGNSYVSRHKELDWRARVPFWRDIIEMTGAHSILEVGCNAGGNLLAIRRALRELDADVAGVWGCDINQGAIEEAADAGLSVVEAGVFQLHEMVGGLPGFDLTASVGVLIHVAPEDLSRAMDEIIAASKRYVLAVEYADETEVEVQYRGHAGRLWRRPFGKMYEAKGLKVVAEFDAPADAFDRCRAWICEKA